MSKILLVDDEPATLRVLSAILEDEGYQVVLAKRGEEALTVLAEDSDVAVVVTDLMMPGMNGRELAQRLRAAGYDAPFLGVSEGVKRYLDELRRREG